ADANIAQPGTVIGKYLNCFLFELLEPGRFHNQAVASRLYLRKRESTVAGRANFAAVSFFRVRERDFRLGNDSLLAVLYRAGDRARNLLRAKQACGEQNGAK